MTVTPDVAPTPAPTPAAAPPAGSAVSATRYFALGLLLVVYISNYADRQILNVLAKQIMEDLQLSKTAFGRHVFAVGDAGFKERCQARYRRLHREGHSMLLVSHEPRTIGAFCDRALLLEEGRILMSGPAAAVADRYMSLLTEHEAAALPRSAGR